MTEHLTDYSGFYINNNGRNYLKTNNNTHNKEGLYQAMWTEFGITQLDEYARQKW